MINPHAILLKKSNFAPIVYWTRTTYENCKEMLQDALEGEEVMYIVFNLDENGHPVWRQVSEGDLITEFNLKMSNLIRFENYFGKL